MTDRDVLSEWLCWDGHRRWLPIRRADNRPASSCLCASAVVERREASAFAFGHFATGER